MKHNNKKIVKRFAKEIVRMNHFKTLKPVEQKNGAYSASIEFAGYLDLLCMISDLLKVSRLVLEDDNESDPSLIINPQINVASIIELAIQLLPIAEGEALDKCLMMINELKVNKKNINEKQQ